MSVMVIPSKLNLLRDAKPLHEIARNQNIAKLVVPRAIQKEVAEAIQADAIRWAGLIEMTDHDTLVVMGLDKEGQFVASYRTWYWPHGHVCPVCGMLIRCECEFPEIDFDDCLAHCPKCKSA